MSKRILLVEDDPNLGMILNEYLQLKGGYNVTLCRDGEEAISAFSPGAFDLCIFDVMMPRKDGFTLGREVRALEKDIPIIFATAKSMLEDKIEGFNLGGDDYITKPFRIEELLLRISALLKRSTNGNGNSKEQTQFKIGKYDFDAITQQLSIDDLTVKLSTKESELLRLLSSHANDILSREEALISIWKEDTYFNARSMDVYLSKLRKLLKQDEYIEIINVHGRGYKLIC